MVLISLYLRGHGGALSFLHLCFGSKPPILGSRKEAAILNTIGDGNDLGLPAQSSSYLPACFLQQYNLASRHSSR